MTLANDPSKIYAPDVDPLINERRQEQRFILKPDTVQIAVITTSAQQYSGELLQFFDYSRSGFSFLSPCLFSVGTFLSIQLTKNTDYPIDLDVMICNRKKILEQYRYGIFSRLGECEIVPGFNSLVQSVD
jgi:hypothetical protein